MFGPEKHDGAKFHHHCAKQGVNKATQFIGQARQQSQLGNVMMIGVETLQLIAGIGQPILESTGHLSHLPKGWVTTLREFLNFANATIETTNAWMPKLQRENDTHMMDAMCSTSGPEEI